MTENAAENTFTETVAVPVSDVVEPAPVNTPGVATAAVSTTSHDPTPGTVAVDPAFAPQSDAASPTPVVEPVSPPSVTDTALPVDETLSRLPAQVDSAVVDSSALIREIHTMVTEIHSVIEAVAPIVTDALSNLGSNPLLKMFTGK